MAGSDYVKDVTCAEPYLWSGTDPANHNAPYQPVGTKFGGTAPVGRRFKVAAFDYGSKHSIFRKLVQHGFDVLVLPASATPELVREHKPDGVFLSNGPGDPAALPGPTAAVAALLGRVPIFGICLGHQILATALGGSTYKLPFGHHGSNHPVKRLATGQVEVTSQNHNYAVIDVPGAEVSHVNLNDGVVEGIASPAAGAFSVQYHPEAGPGPHDARYLFAEFSALMDAGLPARRR